MHACVHVYTQVISRESAEADKVKVVVSKEESAASEEAAKVQAIKDECEADLAEAMPLLENALRVSHVRVCVCVWGGVAVRLYACVHMHTCRFVHGCLICVCVCVCVCVCRLSTHSLRMTSPRSRA